MLDELLPGTVKTLDELSSRGYVPRVLTARTHPDRALRQVDRLLADHVDSTHVVSPRAAPEGKGRWLKAWSAAAFVGDTEADASAARAEGIPFYAVCSGQRSQKYLLAWGLRVFADLEEVARALP